MEAERPFCLHWINVRVRLLGNADTLLFLANKKTRFCYINTQPTYSETCQYRFVKSKRTVTNLVTYLRHVSFFVTSEHQAIIMIFAVHLTLFSILFL